MQFEWISSCRPHSRLFFSLSRNLEETREHMETLLDAKEKHLKEMDSAKSREIEELLGKSSEQG